MVRLKGITPDAVVGLTVERSFEMIIGIIAILKAGGACLPIDPDYPEERKKYMIKDSSVGVLLTDRDIQGISMDLPGDTVLTGNVGNIDKGSNLVYIIYTSGSTGRPKGVMLEHGNLINLIRYQYKYTGIDFTRVLQFTTISFDVSFQEIFSTLLAGGELYLISKETRDNIPGLFGLIEENEIKTLFLAAGFLKFVFTVEDYINIFPRGITHLVTAGEQVVVNGRLKKYLKENRVFLHNHYGPSETHVVTSLTVDPTGEIPHLPSIGRPVLNTYIYILDKYDRLLPTGVSGELYISGIQVGRGYSNQPELTAEKFCLRRPGGLFSRKLPPWTPRKSFSLGGIPGSHGNLSDVQCPMTNERLYRTGDLARWLPDGNIEFLGRMDHQVKIRGFRIELGEIESRLLSREEIKETVVLAKEKEDGEKYLCAYIVTGDRDDPGGDSGTGELREYLNRLLPDYMVPSFFMKLDRMPLTPNGKINREALPVPDFKNDAPKYTAPRDAVERKLVEIWSQVLAIEKEKIGIDDNFFQLGGHSLRATILVSKIHKEFTVKVPLAEVFRVPTVRLLSGYIKGGDRYEYLPVEAAEKRDYYVLSSQQKRLYILQQMEEDNISYNLPMVVRLEGELNKEKFEKVFMQLIDRHESLRTSFGMMAEEPVQLVHDHVKFEIEYYSSATGAVGDRSLKYFPRPFDLSKAPLLRVGLIESGREQHILMLDMHHIITDGTSQEIFTQEFMALYGGKELPALRLQYNDFSGWQNNHRQREAIIKQEEYWKQQFEGEIPVLHLPTDYPRPAVQSFKGRAISFEISEGETAALAQLALTESTSLYMVLLSLYTVFLAKITGQEDIVVGTPVAGRSHMDLQQITGMFVNTLGIRNYPGGGKTFSEFLQEVKEKTLKAFENQGYPFEELVEKVSVTRDAGRNPLFDTMFVLQNVDRSEIKIPGLKLKPYNYKSRISKFDLTLRTVEAGNRLRFTFNYCTGLFRAAAIERFVGYSREIVASVLKNTGQKIGEIEIIPEPEKRLLLEEFNDTAAEYPGDKTLHELFEEQVQRTPDSAAVVGHGCMNAWLREEIIITYRELNKRSEQLAHLLKEKGALADSIVGIMVKRSVEMITGILGILKAGGAYLPIDPEYPQERIDYMLKDSNARILVSEVIEVNSAAAEDHLYLSPAPATSLAYVIYTSGTTGWPKGVMVEHRNAVNVVSWFGKKYRLNTRSHMLQMSDYTFDPSVNQVFGTLLFAGVLYIVDKDLLYNIEALRRYIEKYQIHVLYFVPVMLDKLLCSGDGQRLESVQVVLSGGEKLEEPVKNNIIRKGYTLYNQYGPTEATIDALAAKCTDIESKVTLGKPISNVNCYILDKCDRPVPIKVTGELCIGGAGVARGYLNNPELTAEKFLNKSFSGGPGGRFFKKAPLAAGGKLYKTGDLARWLPDGNIEFSGRIDSQVKIRGFRIELGEIESQLLNHEKVKKAVVLAKEYENDDKFLCAYIVGDADNDDELEISELREYLSRTLPEYMIPGYFVQLGSIPLTPHGKIDRKALPEPEVRIKEIYTSPTNQLEKKLVGIWSDVLRIEKDRIGIHDNFFQLGGHSLKATILNSQIYRELSVKLPLAAIFENPTIRGLAAVISKSGAVVFQEIPPVEARKYYPLSYNQSRLFLLQQMEPGSPAFHMPGYMDLKHEVDQNVIKQVLDRLIRHHESFRTAFIVVEDHPFQVVLKNVEMPFEFIDVSAKNLEFTEAEQACNRVYRQIALKLFHLPFAPLFRAALVKLAPAHYRFMFNMHHIVSDGWSMEILKKEFNRLYEAHRLGREMELPVVSIQYKDFALRQTRQMQGPEGKKSLQFWRKKIEQGLPELQLRKDNQETGDGLDSAGYRFALENEVKDKLKQIAVDNNTGIFTVMCAVLNILLSRLSNQSDVVTGILGAGRNHDTLQNIMGFFVNTLVMKNHVAEHEPFPVFLSRVHRDMLEILQHQDYPLESVFEDLGVRFPDIPLLFNMFNLNERASEQELETSEFEPSHIENVQDAKFEIVIFVTEYKNGIRVNCRYRKAVYKKERIEYIMRRYIGVLKTVAADPGKPIKEYIFKEKRKKRNVRLN
jgi:amino acid adenylation domain-containing protein